MHLPAFAPETEMSWQLQFLSVPVKEQQDAVEVVPVIVLQLSVVPKLFWDHSADTVQTDVLGTVLTIAMIEHVPRS